MKNKHGYTYSLLDQKGVKALEMTKVLIFLSVRSAFQSTLSFHV